MLMYNHKTASFMILMLSMTQKQDQKNYSKLTVRKKSTHFWGQYQKLSMLSMLTFKINMHIYWIQFVRLLFILLVSFTRLKLLFRRQCFVVHTNTQLLILLSMWAFREDMTLRSNFCYLSFSLSTCISVLY